MKGIYQAAGKMAGLYKIIGAGVGSVHGQHDYGSAAIGSFEKAASLRFGKDATSVEMPDRR